MSGVWNRLFIALSIAALIGCRHDGAGLGPAPSPPPAPPPPPPPPPPSVATVGVSLAGVSIVIGRTTQASAELKDASGQVITGRSVVWSSSDQGLATVSASGLVTGVAEGSVTINATSEGKVGSAVLEVLPIPVAAVTVTTTPPTIEVGQSSEATVELRGAGGEVLTGRAVAWSSSDETVATVSSEGIVTGLAVGSARIAATAEGVTGDAELAVTAVPVATVAVTLAASSLLVGGQTGATAELRSATGAILSRPVTWISETPGVATISADGTTIIGATVGTTVIRATAEGKTGTAVLTVSAQPVATVQVVVAASLVVGQTVPATATLRDGDGRILTGRAVTWKTSAPAVATISQLGIVTAVSPGSTTITATSEGKSDAVSVGVTAPAARLEITRGATAAASGQVFATQPIVVVKDGWNNLVGTDHATVVSVSVSAGATVVGPGSRVVSAGVASFSALGLSGAAGSYTLTFSAPGLTPASQTIAIDQTAPASFGTGTKRVGSDIAAGLYRSNNPTSAACYWERLSGFTGDLGDILANEVAGGPVVVAIAPTDAGFSSVGCATWIEVTGPITASPTADFDDGSYVVGTDISPGTWRSSGTGSSCIWARLSGFGGTVAEVVAADFVTAPATVTVAPTDKGFAASGCGVWKKIG